jgi:hypothetical protein
MTGRGLRGIAARSKTGQDLAATAQASSRYECSERFCRHAADSNSSTTAAILTALNEPVGYRIQLKDGSGALPDGTRLAGARLKPAREGLPEAARLADYGRSSRLLIHSDGPAKE